MLLMTAKPSHIIHYLWPKATKQRSYEQFIQSLYAHKIKLIKQIHMHTLVTLVPTQNIVIFPYAAIALSK